VDGYKISLLAMTKEDGSERSLLVMIKSLLAAIKVDSCEKSLLAAFVQQEIDANDAVGNSPGVRQKLAEGIGSLPRWCKGVRQKKTETHRKIIGGSRLFTEGIGKLTRNMSGDHRRKTVRLAMEIPKVAGIWE
ncbi:hypothetical protein B296_00011909, partial [Ensete ventricosum]